MRMYGSFCDPMDDVKHPNAERSLYGYSRHKSSLPTDLPNGSTAYCSDTGEALMFMVYDKKWVPAK